MYCSNKAGELLTSFLESIHVSRRVYVLVTASSDARFNSWIVEVFKLKKTPIRNCSVGLTESCESFIRNPLSISPGKTSILHFVITFSLLFEIIPNKEMQ